MDNLYYETWIGNNYKNTKYLIIGESFYGVDNDSKNRVNLVINDCIDGSWEAKTFISLQELLTGNYIKQNNDFFQNFAYHQLLQNPVKNNNSKREGWKDGWRILFNEVIPKLKPEKILFIGVTSLNYISSLKKEFDFLNALPVKCGIPIKGSTYPRYLKLNIAEIDMELLWIHHLSPRNTSKSPVKLWREMMNNDYPNFLFNKG